MKELLDQFIRKIFELLDLVDSVTEHQKKLKGLMTEIYKVKNGIGPEIMKDISNYKIVRII